MYYKVLSQNFLKSCRLVIRSYKRIIIKYHKIIRTISQNYPTLHGQLTNSAKASQAPSSCLWTLTEWPTFLDPNLMMMKINPTQPLYWSLLIDSLTNSKSYLSSHSAYIYLNFTSQLLFFLFLPSSIYSPSNTCV